MNMYVLIQPTNVYLQVDVGTHDWSTAVQRYVEANRRGLFTWGFEYVALFYIFNCYSMFSEF